MRPPFCRAGANSEGKAEDPTGAAPTEKNPDPFLRFRKRVPPGDPDRVSRSRRPASRSNLAPRPAGFGSGRGDRSGKRCPRRRVPRRARRGPGRPEGRHRSPAKPGFVSPAGSSAEWLQPNQSAIVHRFDPDAGIVRAARIERYDALVLGEHPTKPDDAIAAGLLADAWKARPPRAADEQLLRRLAFAGRSMDVDDLVRLAARDARALDDVQLARALPPEVLRALDREAPAMLAVPSGRSVPLEYSAGRRRRRGRQAAGSVRAR